RRAGALIDVVRNTVAVRIARRGRDGRRSGAEVDLAREVLERGRVHHAAHRAGAAAARAGRQLAQELRAGRIVADLHRVDADLALEARRELARGVEHALLRDFAADRVGGAAVAEHDDGGLAALAREVLSDVAEHAVDRRALGEVLEVRGVVVRRGAIEGRERLGLALIAAERGGARLVGALRLRGNERLDQRLLRREGVSHGFRRV